MKRDKETCVITQAGEPIEVCHIYPYTMGNCDSQDIITLLALISCFFANMRKICILTSHCCLHILVFSPELVTF